TGVIGGVGRRTITMGGEDVSTDLFNNGFKCYTNGDFNGDGYSDLLWHSDDAEITAIWNMGPEGMIKSAGFIQPESMGPGWSFGGIGKFGYSGTGCCIFWHNVFDGQTAVWVIDSSHANEIDWIVGGVFLDTVELLSNTPRVTNNVVQNGGTGVYWQDELIGQLAYWPIAVNTNISGASIAGAGFITLDGLELLFPFDFGINVAGVGNMAGRPVSEGTSSLRDIVSVNDITGETLVWLMSSDHTSINTSAVGNTGATGGGYTTRLGLVTFDNFYNFEGIGQYNVWATYAIPPGAGFLPGGPLRQTWFANLFWSNPDVASNFSWKMDRNIDLLDYSTTPAAPTGTGLLVDPYEIIGTAPLD
ncbi:MAG: hypothetical protein VX527_10200, partial [Planctomycetota bacterium]|nr:hypothetical protein [Planctomycetota bacterium]